MLKKEQVFEGLKKGWKKERIMKEFNISQASYYNYNNLYRKQKENVKAEELAQHKLEKIVKESKVEGLQEIVENSIKSETGPGRTPMTILTVDLELECGTILKDASIFNDSQPGIKSIQSIVEIEHLIKGITPIWNRGFIYFQTACINGQIHSSYIKDFKVNLIEY